MSPHLCSAVPKPCSRNVINKLTQDPRLDSSVAPKPLNHTSQLRRHHPFLRRARQDKQLPGIVLAKRTIPQHLKKEARGDMQSHICITPSGGVRHQTLGRKSEKYPNTQTGSTDFTDQNAVPTKQEQFDFSGGLLPVVPQVFVNHLTPLHRGFVLGADRAAHVSSHATSVVSDCGFSSS
ncbi:hypothetical protein EYF80_006890 [Liparis tanakae]|uniref:Uncharacterized protein n=1 Tax=Liparis tanakae TaxID=230148 RepID=A0A4Z2J0F7_9TELE|nr:hypothetical protein EYF80_006890 [Liparis tanakae]